MSISIRYRLTRSGTPTGIIYVNGNLIDFSGEPHPHNPLPITSINKEILSKIIDSTSSTTERYKQLQQWLRINPNG